MIIFPQRVHFIKKHFFEFTFETDEENEDPIPDFQIFKTLSSAEQYYLASLFNWDDGVIVLDWIIESPKCDKGTATMIFWMAEPDFYFNFTEETVDEWAMDVWRLLQKIIYKMNNHEFKTAKFPFNPTKNGYQTEWDSAKGIWELPRDLIIGTKGVKPIVLG